MIDDEEISDALAGSGNGHEAEDTNVGFQATSTNECDGITHRPVDERTQRLGRRVFENHLILENIVKCAIFPSGKKNITDRSDLANLRLVSKSWLKAVTACMRRAKEPLLRVTCDRNNSVEGTSYCNLHGKMLDRFNASLTTAADLEEDEIPLFSLKLLPDFFRRQNHESLARTFTEFGNGLLELDISIPIDRSLEFIFPSFRLPKLNSLVVEFSKHRILDDICLKELQNNGHTVLPLQNLLNATSVLKDLKIDCSYPETCIPFGFEYVTLPKTLASVILNFAFTQEQMQILLKNDLPRLTNLTLIGMLNPPNEGLPIFQVLSKYRTTLQTLTLRGYRHHGHIPNPTILQFPVMEKLKVLTVASQTWELENDNDERMNLGQKLPVLEDLRLLRQTKRTFNNWTSNSRYNLVNRLVVSLVNRDGDYPLNINQQRMQALNLAFPNVVCLEVTVCVNHTCGLGYILMNMRRLRRLAVVVMGNVQNVRRHFHWDEVLLGLPTEMNRNNERAYQNYPSIADLNQLRTLALVDRCVPASTSLDLTQTFISDMCFHQAFFGMANLKTLWLSGRFKTSTKIMEMWRGIKGTDIIEPISFFV